MPEQPETAKSIASDLREQIRYGRLGPGAQLPAGRELARRYGVQLKTLQNAVKLLIADGLVYSRQGSGTFVADPPKGETTPRETVQGLRELTQQFEHLSSQMTELRERLDRLEGADPSRSDDNQ